MVMKRTSTAVGVVLAVVSENGVPLIVIAIQTPAKMGFVWLAFAAMAL